MTRTWMVVVAWVFVAAGAALGIALASGQAGAETSPEEGAAADQYVAADGSEAAPADPGSPVSGSASASANAPASGSASASAPTSEVGPVDEGSVDNGTPEDPSDEANSSAPGLVEASASAASSASASASAGASAPSDATASAPAEEGPGADDDDGVSDGAASASASASAGASASAPEETFAPAPGEDLVDDGASGGSGEPDVQPKAGGPAPPDPHPDGPPPALFEDEPYYESCYEPDYACGLDVPKHYVCDMVYEGRPGGTPDRYECMYYKNAEARYTEGPNGEECIEKQVYASPDDESPETIYDCTGGKPSKNYYLCEYDSEWNATRCVKPFAGGDPEDHVEKPPDSGCGENDCGLDVPKRYECQSEYWSAGKYRYFCAPQEEDSFRSPDGDSCWKTYRFTGRNAERETIYYCGRHFGDYDRGWGCPWYDADWEKIPCGPPDSGGGATGAGALKPSEDAQDAIKDEREEQGGGWQSIRQFGNAAVGFVGDGGDSGGDSGGATGGDSGGTTPAADSVAGPAVLGSGGVLGPEPTVPEVSRVEGGDAPSLGTVPGGSLDSWAGGSDYTSFAAAFSGETGGSAGSTAEKRAAGGDVGATAASVTASGGSAPVDRDGGVQSASMGEGRGDGGASSGGSDQNGAEPNAGANSGADGSTDAGGQAGEESGVLAAVKKASGAEVERALGGGGAGWIKAAIAGSGALVVGALGFAEVRRRDLAGAGRVGPNRRSG